MSDLINKWYLNPKFLEDDARVSSQREPTGAVIFRRASPARIIESADFGEIRPSALDWNGNLGNGLAVSEMDFSFEYNGYYPIQIQGFFLQPHPKESFMGTIASPEESLRQLLEWGQSSLQDQQQRTFPGLYIKQTEFIPVLENGERTGTFVEQAFWRRFSHKPRGGSSAGDPLPIILHPDMPSPDILSPGDRVHFTLRFVAPRDDDIGAPIGEALTADIMNVALDVLYREITPDMNFDPIAWSSDVCDGEA